MIILAFFLPPLALFAMKKWGAGFFVLILWLLSFPALMFFVIPGVALWGISAAIAMYYAVQYGVDKQFDKIAGAINQAGERLGPHPEPRREMQRKERTPPGHNDFQGGGHDTRVDVILGKPQKRKEAVPASGVQGVASREVAPPPPNPLVVFVVRFVSVVILTFVVVTVLMQQRPQLVSDASSLVNRALNYVGGKKETAIVAEVPLPEKPREPVPIPQIEITQDPVKPLGVPGRVTGIRIISDDEMPTTIQPGGPTAVATDKQTGVKYACYLERVIECEDVFKKESSLEQIARASPMPTAEILPVPEVPPVVEKKWNHNDSWLRLEVNGTRRRFLFTQPREGLREEGVTEGMVAFDGIQRGDVLEGTAYVFSRRCGPIGFPVSGEAQMGARMIKLTGPRPYVDAQCRPAKSEQGVLMFQQKD